MSEPPKILGSGGYGSVTQDGNSAVKHFSKHRHLIQEVYILAYFRDCKNILKVRECNFDTLTMKSELWNSNLQNILKDNWSGKHKLSSTCSHAIYKSILIGLHFMHIRHTVHADIKPSNVLVSADRMSACLGDLGLSSICNKARTDLTTEVFSPKDRILHYRSHDMFGVALIGLELLAGYRVYCSLSSKDVRQVISTSNMPPEFKNCFKAMVSENPRKCLKPGDVLQSLYNIQITNYFRPCVRLDKLLSLHSQVSIEELTKSISKIYNIYRPKRCSRCTMTLISRLPDIDFNKLRMYTIVMCFVFSSCFGNRRMKLTEILKELGETQTTSLNAALATIAVTPEVINLMYAP